MVLSAASLSLEPPLAISEAMEKALAREDSWGLGDDVNSIASAGAVRAGPPPSGGTQPDSSSEFGDQKRARRCQRPATRRRPWTRVGSCQAPPRDRWARNRAPELGIRGGEPKGPSPNGDPLLEGDGAVVARWAQLGDTEPGGGGPAP